MILERREAGGFEPVGSRLPSHLTPPYRTFFANVLNGKYASPAPDQIDAAVDQHFSTGPLNPLTQAEEKDLRSDMTGFYNHTCSLSNQWRAVAGDIYLTGANTLIAGEPEKKDGMLPLTPQQKEDLLTNPDFYNRARLINGRVTSPLGGYGTRHLTIDISEIDSYGITNQDFLKMLAMVRRFQRKGDYAPLMGLDIGGGTGIGATDAEQLDPNLQMTSITANAETGTYPLRGGHVITLAEIMPRYYFEQFDLIISNMAFMYFRFPEIALNNALLALRRGGIARISFSPERSKLLDENRMEELTNRISGQFEIMDRLETEGVIRYLPAPKWIKASEKYYPNGRKKPVQHGLVYLQKIQSMK